MANWHIDPETLREVVDDREALEQQLVKASPLDQVWMLRILGRLSEAERIGREQLDAATDRWRPLLLLADVRRWQGSLDEATSLQDEAAALADSPARRATTNQHIGKRLMESGDAEAAAENFQRALDLREAVGAASDVIESSRAALRRARR
jgi:tetratricopeptide (TPR) repeat protein